MLHERVTGEELFLASPAGHSPLAVAQAAIAVLA